MDEKKVREAIKEFEIEKQTHEDMISYCKHFEPKNDCGRYEEKIAMYKTAIEALEKQLPKKPEKCKNGDLACSCGLIIQRKNRITCLYYCHNCGQRLDWSE